MATQRNLDNINWQHPRTIWVLAYQLFFALLVQLPLYYYMREILKFTNTSYEAVVFGLPIVIGFLIFFIEIMFDQYFWQNEKVLRNRDILIVGMKSSILAAAFYFVTFFFFFGYVLNSWKIYVDNGLKDPMQKLFFELFVSFFAFYLFAGFLQTQSLSLTKTKTTNV